MNRLTPPGVQRRARSHTLPRVSSGACSSPGASVLRHPAFGAPGRARRRPPWLIACALSSWRSSAFTAVLVLLPTVVQAGPVPNCVGTDPCTGNTGDIGEGACIGNFSCFDNSGDIAKNGCHDLTACNRNAGAVGEGACHGQLACFQNQGDVRKASCMVGYSVRAKLRFGSRGLLYWRQRLQRGIPVPSAS